MKLVSRFAGHSPTLRSEYPLSDDQIRSVVPSIYADAPHAGRSPRYSYIPTVSVLRELREEGFQPFMVCQTKVRDDARRSYTKHMIRLRHVSQINGHEANEIILVNSHDGTSSYQMLSGMFRFVCKNGLVLGDRVKDIRVPHRGDVAQVVVEGAYEVLRGFERIEESRDGMRAIMLDKLEAGILGQAALVVKFGEQDGSAPITGDQLLKPRRMEDEDMDLWTVFNRIQENMIRGGLSARSASGRKLTTRPVTGIDSELRLNRALWVLAEGMRKMKA